MRDSVRRAHEQQRARPADPPADYRGAFRHWDSRASVRVTPRREPVRLDREGVHFTPELVPFLDHPLVAGLDAGAVRRILTQRLYQYLDFTTTLEQTTVLPVTARISCGKAGLELPEVFRSDAFAITTDEAWHAQLSNDLVTGLVSETGIRPARAAAQFERRLEQLRDRAEPAVRGALDLVFTIVSETLISAILRDLPADARLPGPVRDFVADHAEDEARHHVYFRALLKHLWPALTKAEQRMLGPVVPELIWIFLEPDYGRTALILADAGLTPNEVDEVLLTSFTPSRTAEAIARDAGTATRYFQEIGALDESRTRDAFAAAGLLAPEGHGR